MEQTDIYPSENIGKSVCKSIEYNQWKKACFSCAAVQWYSDSTALIKTVVILFIFGIIVIENVEKRFFVLLLAAINILNWISTKKETEYFCIPCYFTKAGNFPILETLNDKNQINTIKINSILP